MSAASAPAEAASLMRAMVPRTLLSLQPWRTETLLKPPSLSASLVAFVTAIFSSLERWTASPLLPKREQYYPSACVSYRTKEVCCFRQTTWQPRGGDNGCASKSLTHSDKTNQTGLGESDGMLLDGRNVQVLSLLIEEGHGRSVDAMAESWPR